MPSIEQLKKLQNMSLYEKVITTKMRIREWISYYGENNVFVSFSGGKDSTVLLNLVRQEFPNVEAVFVNTGLEYPEIQAFVKSFDNVTILRPKMRFDEVIKKYGYPFISKEVSECVAGAKKYLMGGGTNISLEKLTDLENMPIRTARILGKLTKMNTIKETIPDYDKSRFNKEKYKPLLYVDFNISNQCCNIMKKNPSHEYSKKTGKMPITAQTTEESDLRKQAWLKNGCNGFDMKMPISNPMSFWREQDILKYIKENNIKIASVYGDIVTDSGAGLYDTILCDCGKLKCTQCQRTGCIFCGYGSHNKNDNRFVLLKQTHPKQYEYCMKGGEYNEKNIWQPNKKGLGLKHCIDVLNNIYGENFIKY